MRFAGTEVFVAVFAGVMNLMKWCNIIILELIIYQNTDPEGYARFR